MESECGTAAVNSVNPDKSILVEANKARGGSKIEMTPETLQKLIMEKKEERKRNAEEKRLEDLRRIVEMNSRDGLHPVEDLFPEEIWIKILKDKDLSPRDRYNMRQVHPVFEDLMNDTEIQDILLPLVLDQKVPFVKGLIQSPESLNMKPILTLRRVSKSVRDSVDKYIDEHLVNSLRILDGEPHLRFHYYSTPLCLYPTDQDQKTLLTSFIKGPIAERPKRFFLKSLQVKFTPTRHLSPRDRQHFPGLFASFKGFVTEFLETVGSQILFFHLTFSHMEGIVDMAGVPMAQVVYELIREWLLLMPNLRCLALGISPMYSTIPQGHHHLPMPTLHVLEGVIFPEEVSPILEALLVANPHVNYIHNLEGSIFMMPYTHPAVLNLALDAVDFDSVSLLRITGFNWNWNVKRMRVLLDDDVSLGAVFQCLQENFPNLEQLSLDFWGVTTIGKGLEYLLLPNLREFKITLQARIHFTGDFHFFFGLQFLLHCDQLESLTWNNCMDGAELLKIGFELLGSSQNELRLIDFQGEGGMVRMDMRSSNIWDVFPKLRRITMKFKRYWYGIDERRGPLSLYTSPKYGSRPDQCIYTQPS